MKQSLKLFILLFAISIGIASIGNAARYGGSYIEPTISAPGDNAEVVPINTGGELQAKAGSLAVTTFLSRGLSVIQGQTFFKDYVTGGDVLDANRGTELYFGDPIKATGTIASTQTFQSDTLVPQQGSWAYVCADSEGVLTTNCPDMCPNIPGVQPTIPPDMTLSGSNCMQELMLNTPGYCEYQMIAERIDDMRAKFTLQRQDGTRYLYNGTMSIAIKFENGNMRIITAPQGQIANYDFGAITNHIRILGVLPGTISGGEVCWRGY